VSDVPFLKDQDCLVRYTRWVSIWDLSLLLNEVKASRIV
jgi:hypothetical protein